MATATKKRKAGTKPKNQFLEKLFDRIDKKSKPEDKGLYVFSYPRYAKEILHYILDTDAGMPVEEARAKARASVEATRAKRKLSRKRA